MKDYEETNKLFIIRPRTHLKCKVSISPNGNGEQGNRFAYQECKQKHPWYHNARFHWQLVK